MCDKNGCIRNKQHKLKKTCNRQAKKQETSKFDQWDKLLSEIEAWSKPVWGLYINIW